MNKKMSLSADSILKVYGSKKVVNNVSLELKQGEIVGLLGPNGAGKTTTFYTIVGLIRPDNGNVNLGGEDITKLPMYERARKGIGYLAQEASVFRDLSIQDNILAVLENQNISTEDRHKKADILMNEFGLISIKNNKGKVLSGGERRRLEIARCMAAKPNFVLLDEPLAGIDPIAIQDIKNLIQNLKSNNIGVLITDHNVKSTLEIVDRAYIIFEGKVLFEGKPDEIVNNKNVQAFYLGQNF